MAPLYRGNWLVKLTWLSVNKTARVEVYICVPANSKRFVICARELTSSPIPIHSGSCVNWVHTGKERITGSLSTLMTKKISKTDDRLTNQSDPIGKNLIKVRKLTSTSNERYSNIILLTLNRY